MNRSLRNTICLFGCLGLLISCSSDPEGESGGSAGNGGQGGSGGSDITGPVSGQVVRYDYAFDLETRQAHSAVSIEVAPPGGDCLDIACRLAGLDQVMWNGQAAREVMQTDQALHLCGQPVLADSTLNMASQGTVPEQLYLGLDVGFSRRSDLAGGEFTYLLSWVQGCDRFGPCDSDPSQFAEFHFEITHPANTVVLCPGTLTPSSTMTRCDVAGTLAPTYSAFAFAADPLWQRTPFLSAGGVDLVFYEVPGGQIMNSLDPVSVGDFMTWITTLLGPFPYGNELRLAGGPTYWLGFEHPSNILLYEEIGGLATSYQDTAMHVMMHEIVHQWAGDRTSLLTAQDFVWKEATAEYLAYVFEDEQRPAGEAAATRSYWDTISVQASHHPRPTDDPPPAVHTFYGDVYGPGPMVLYVQLESMLGRNVVLDGIKSFLSSPGARSVTDLQAALESASSQDLTSYFDAWVFGTGAPEWPSFDVSLAQAGNQVTVTVTQQNPSGTLYPCAIEVEVLGATQSAKVVVDFGLAPSSPVATATLTFGEQAQSFNLDPDHRVIGYDISGGVPAPITKKLPVWIF